MGITSDPEIKEILNRFSGTLGRDDSFSFHAAKHLGNFKV